MITNDLQTLIERLSKLPGLGPRSGRRLALHLLKQRDEKLYPLIKALQTAADNLQDCQVCGNLDTHTPCLVCQDPKRDQTSLCVVEGVADLWAIERAGCHKGLYHILGGTLSALEGIGPEDLRFNQLVHRVRTGAFQEVILALNATVEGHSTTHYLMDILEPTGVTLSTLAQGVPFGGELDYLDDGTLMTAMQARKKAA